MDGCDPNGVEVDEEDEIQPDDSDEDAITDEEDEEGHDDEEEDDGPGLSYLNKSQFVCFPFTVSL